MQLSYNKIIYNSGLPALKLDLKLPHEEMLDEFKKLEMVSQIGNTKWTGCALRGLSSDKPRPYYEYGYNSDSQVPYKWTKQGKLCKKSLKFLKGTFTDCDFYRIKVQTLLPGGKIHPHNDSLKSGLGKADKVSDSDSTFLTMAVHWPKEVIFNLDNYRIPIRTGDIYLLNFSKYHEVYNPTREIRYYLLVTGKFHDSKSWQDLVIKSYKKYGDKKFPSKEKINHN